MKKLLLILLLATSVFAVSIDEECKDNHFSTGIAKFESIGSAAEGPVYPFDINVTGNLQEAEWESNEYVSGVIVKAGQNVEVFDGGYEGTVTCLDEEKCKDEQVSMDEGDSVEIDGHKVMLLDAAEGECSIEVDGMSDWIALDESGLISGLNLTVTQVKLSKNANPDQCKISYPDCKTICQDISHITFCKNGASNGNGGHPPNGVPEFSPATLGLVVLLGTLGVVVLRKN